MKRPVIVLTALACVVAAIVGAYLPAKTPSAASQRELASAIELAATFHMTDWMPTSAENRAWSRRLQAGMVITADAAAPSKSTSMTTLASEVASSKKVPNILLIQNGPKAVSAGKAAALARIDTLFVGDAAEQQRKMVRRALASMSAGAGDDFLTLDAGAEDVTVTSSGIRGDSATMSGTFRTWALKAMRMSHTARFELVRPSHVAGFEASLQRQGDHWVISDFTWDYLSGGA